MVSYLQLQAEPWWGDEFTSPGLTAFNERMRQYYNLTVGQVGSKGDNNHLYGRHRSYNWAINSVYCTDRTYGTSNPKDQPGDRDWIRATDIGISGPVHWAAAHRLDAAVRAGRLPGVAEWFGTFNGQTVTGWFEGGPGTSDDSHLYHLHVGYWNSSANDVAMFQLLGNIITGVDSGGDMYILHIPANINPNGLNEYWLYDQYGKVDQKPDSASLRGMYARGGVPTVELGSADLPSGWTWARFLGELESQGAKRCPDCDGSSGGGGGLTEDEVRTIVRGELDRTKLGGF